MNEKTSLEKVNEYLTDVESFANDFLPIKGVLEPIQEDFNVALDNLKEKAKNSDDLADKVFYLNRYADLVKRVEGIFDIRSKRLQQTISTLLKSNVGTATTIDSAETAENNQEDVTPLTPEKANEILKILNN